jgi:hypothetical protein
MAARDTLLRLLERRALTIAATAFAVGVALFFGYVSAVGWGPPGTLAYEAYERANRIMLAPLLVHLAAWLVVLHASARGATVAGTLGATMLVGGNIGEFWLFSAEEYTSAARVLSWTSCMFGALVSVTAFALLTIGGPRPRTTS